MMKCKQCGKGGFREFWQVAKHARKEHPKTETMPATERETEPAEVHTCYKCNSEFKTRRTLQQHMRNVHGITKQVRADQPHAPVVHMHTCPSCGAEFAVITEPGTGIKVALEAGSNGKPA